MIKMLKSRLTPLRSKISAPPKTADEFYGSAEWKRTREAVRRARGRKCERCGAGGTLYVDHIVGSRRAP